jgi:hypothetical protein
MSSHLYINRWKPKEGRNRAKRPKSFKTTEGAKVWAEKTKLKDYEVVNFGTEKHPKYKALPKSK